MSIRKQAFLTIAIFALVNIAYAEAITDHERDEAEAHFADHIVPQNLHNMKSFPDGAKGTFISEYPPRMAGDPGDPADPQFLPLQSEYCYSDAIMSAEAIDSIAYLHSKKSTIITRATFKVNGIIKEFGNLSVNDIVTASYLGGEVTENGELLRVENLGHFPAKPGSSYLLSLKVAKTTKNTFFLRGPLVELKKNRIVLRGVEWLGFKPGTTVEEFQNKLSSVVHTKPCK